MGYDDALNAETAEAVYGWLEHQHPGAPLCFVGFDGLTVPVPDGFPAGEHVVLKGRSALDFVEPSDHVAVVGAWERALANGGSHVHVRLVSGRSANLHFLDLRHRWGCHVAVFAPADEDAASSGDEILAGHDDRTSIPPRVCRLRRDQLAVITAVDAAATELLGWTAESVVGRRSIELVHPDDVERAIANWMEMLAAPGRPHRWRGRYQHADGSWVWLDITNVNRLEDPAHGDVLTEMVDISDEMAMHEALRERERLLRRLTEALPSGILQFDTSRRTLHVNEQLVGMAGESLDDLVAAVVEHERPRLEGAVAALLEAGADADLELHLSGDRVCTVALRALTDESGQVTGGLVCVDDVTESVEMRRQLELRATFDDLTACYSRPAILSALEDVASEAPGTGVVFVDLDRFKQVNDLYGHGVGDQLLAEVGERIRRAVREVDLVGRVGGDEFLVVCPGVPDGATVRVIAERIGAAIAQPVVLGGEHMVCPQASIGTAWAPAGVDPAALVAQADAAMYAEKRG